MTEPQVWTVIGLFSAMLISMITIVHTAFIRVVRTEFSSLRHELKSEISSLRTELKSDINGLDRDVQTLMRREWNGGTP